MTGSELRLKKAIAQMKASTEALRPLANGEWDGLHEECVVVRREAEALQRKLTEGIRSLHDAAPR